MGNRSSIGKLSMTRNKLGSARKRSFQSWWVTSKRCSRVRSGNPANKASSSRLSQREKARKWPPIIGKEQADGHQLAWIQLRLMVLRNLFHLVIDKAEHMDDHVFGGHDLLSFRVNVCSSLLDTHVPRDAHVGLHHPQGKSVEEEGCSDTE